MNIVISGHHLPVTPAIKAYVTSKLERVLRHSDQVIGAHVTLSVTNDKEKQQKAEISLRMKGKDLFAEQQHSDMYAAIDTLIDKLDRQVIKHKERLQGFDHSSVRTYESEPTITDQ